MNLDGRGISRVLVGIVKEESGSIRVLDEMLEKATKSSSGTMCG